MLKAWEALQRQLVCDLRRWRILRIGSGWLLWVWSLVFLGWLFVLPACFQWLERWLRWGWISGWWLLPMDGRSHGREGWRLSGCILCKMVYSYGTYGTYGTQIFSDGLSCFFNGTQMNSDGLRWVITKSCKSESICVLFVGLRWFYFWVLSKALRFILGSGP